MEQLSLFDDRERSAPLASGFVLLLWRSLWDRSIWSEKGKF